MNYLDPDKIDRRAAGSLRLLGKLLPGGREFDGEYVVRVHLRGVPVSLKIDVRSGRWSELTGSARGTGAVSLLAFLDGVSETEAARKLAVMLELREGAR